MSVHDGQLEPIALRRRFGDTVALDGLSFTEPRGQVYGFQRGHGRHDAAGRHLSRPRDPAGREQAQGQASAQIGCLTALIDIELWQERRNPGKPPAARKHVT